SAVLVAIAVEQVLMADLLVASAIAMKLREQRRIFLRDLVGLARRPGEARGIERDALSLGGRGGRICRRAHRPRTYAYRHDHRRGHCHGYPFSPAWLAVCRRIFALGHNAHPVTRITSLIASPRLAGRGGRNCKARPGDERRGVWPAAGAGFPSRESAGENCAGR